MNFAIGIVVAVGLIALIMRVFGGGRPAEPGARHPDAAPDPGAESTSWSAGVGQELDELGAESGEVAAITSDGVAFVPDGDQIHLVPPGSPADEVIRSAPAKFPDPLLEDSPFRLDANQTAAVWITVYAPPKAAPGVYKGEAVIRAGKTRVASVPFRIQVGHATVPPKQTLRVTNWFDLEEANVARYRQECARLEGTIGQPVALAAE